MWANGIRFCVYYSHREDWEDPDGYGNNWDYDRSKKDFERYLERKSIPQVKELLTGYGPLGLIWFDRGTNTPEQGARFVKLVHSLQPQCPINGRVGPYGEELMGDYQDMNDNGMPTGGLDEYWETPQTLNTTWGYSKFDQQWKTPANAIQRLVEIVSKGGNYLLNIGPTGDDTIPPPSIATLKKVGEWMQVNGESIYGTSACPLAEAPWGRCTVKGTKLYLHVFGWPADLQLHINGLLNEVRRAHVLTKPDWKLAVTKENSVITVSLPAGQIDDIDSVIVLELADAPKSDPPIITQGSDSAFNLDYLNAVTKGNAVKRFNRNGRFHISKWTGPKDSAAWSLLVSQAGNYKVRIHYSAPAEWSGAKYVVIVGKETLTGTVQTTGPGYHYAAFNLGTIPIPKAGRYTVVVRPANSSNHNLMYFQALELEPQI